MQQRFLLAFFLLLLAGFAAGQSSGDGVLIPWGTSDQTLGVFQDGDYLRGPAFIDQEPDGTIVVADAYKARIARFSPQGSYRSALPLSEVSPRMTAFRRVPNGTFVLSNDQTVSRWKPSGERLGARGLGLVLPVTYWFTSLGASVVLAVEKGTVTNEFDSSFERESQFSLQTGSAQTAAVKDEKGGILMARWSDQSRVFGWKAPVGPQALLSGGSSSGPSLWTDFADGQRNFWLVDGAGKLLGRLSVPMTPGAAQLYAWNSGTRVLAGQWTEAGLLLREWPLNP